MIKRALIVLCLLPGVSHAVICKTVNADGVVSYTELPANECPSPVKLPEYSRYAPRAVQQATPEDDGVAADRGQSFDGYKAITIVKPESGEALFSNEGKVPLAITLEPGLQPGHRIHVFLDDALVPGRFDGLVIELTGVDPGTHRLRVAVVDDGGKRIIDSASVAFRLHEAEKSEGTAAPDAEPEAG